MQEEQIISPSGRALEGKGRKGDRTPFSSSLSPAPPSELRPAHTICTHVHSVEVNGGVFLTSVGKGIGYGHLS